MNGSSWYTKKDVMQDLALATGVLVDFDEDFIVRGHKPPPNRHQAIDVDEMKLRFGNVNGALPTENVKPDLNGITEMLRMVDKDDTSNKSKEDCDGNGDKQIHTISKLNPDVEEYVPISARTNSDKVSDKCNDENISDNIVNESDSSKCDSDKQKMEAILKEKYKETSKGHSLKDKKEKNVAIQALIKLNSAPPQPKLQTPTPPISCSSSPKPMVLYPPEYYESGPPKEEPKQNYDIQKPVKSEPSAGVVKVDIENKYSNDPSVQESIKKVNNWFEKPVTTTDLLKESLKSEKPESPSPKKQTMALAPPLESFSYKKKDKSSSSSQTKSPLPEVKPVTATPAYKPSPYAAELAKAYAERSKAQEKLEHVDIFTKLQRDLEARDEQIRKKLREKQEGESSNVISPISRR